MKSTGKLWATVIYPESLPSDWRSRTDNLHLPVVVSPLHDADHMDDGSLKKAHYHVLLKLPNPRTRDFVAALFESAFGSGFAGCEMVYSWMSYLRYLCHLDSPEKTQYSPSDVTCFGGATYDIDSTDTDFVRLCDFFFDENRRHQSFRASCIELRKTDARLLMVLASKYVYFFKCVY